VLLVIFLVEKSARIQWRQQRSSSANLCRVVFGGPVNQEKIKKKSGKNRKNTPVRLKIPSQLACSARKIRARKLSDHFATFSLVQPPHSLDLNLVSDTFVTLCRYSYIFMLAVKLRIQYTNQLVAKMLPHNAHFNHQSIRKKIAKLHTLCQKARKN
jgi:hypothetical protein